MATESLSVIISVVDKASAELKTIGSSLESVSDQFSAVGDTLTKTGTTLSLALTAPIVAFGAVAVSEAATAEGAMSKFTTVFAEQSDEMLDFVNELRQEMPQATSEIVAMASGVQDLLVPMGVAREEATDMTQNFLELSNQIAAFNDVSPEDVLDAIKSGLVGSSEPLRQYGVDARVAALESVALSEGLLEAGQSISDLTPEVAAQVQAQALLAQITKQSTDAIEGFAANQDTNIRTFQELTASFTDMAAVVGAILLPVIAPIVEKLIDWLNAFSNLDKSTQTIILVVAALAAALGPVLIVLGFMASAIGSILAILPALGVALGVASTAMTIMLGPVGLVVAAIVALIAVIALIVTHWEEIVAVTDSAWDAISSTVSSAITAVSDAIASVFGTISDFFSAWFEFTKAAFLFEIGLIAGIVITLFDALGIDIVQIFTDIFTFFGEIWESISSLFSSSLDFISAVWSTAWTAISDTASTVWSAIVLATSTQFEKLKTIFSSGLEILSIGWDSFWEGLANTVESVWSSIKSIVIDSINFVIEKINSFIQAVNSIAAAANVIPGVSVPVIPEIPALSFAEGGIVPGPVGQAVPAIVHGGEQIIPVGGSASASTGANITVNVTGNTISNQLDLSDIAMQIGEEIMGVFKLQTKTGSS
jgi:phage-related protein|tara:strand:+ start:25394 stop:27349 length:1956 start_codon:yes stop_codon:yes gene_type:complete